MNKIIIKNLDFLLDEKWAKTFFTKNTKTIFGITCQPKLLKLERSRTFNTESFNVLYIFLVDSRKLGYRLSASTQADRKPTYLVMKYLFDHDFNDGNILVPKPFGYFEECNGYLYENIPGKTIMYELNKNLEILKKNISLAANGLMTLHKLPIPNFKLQNQNRAHNWGLTANSIKKIYPLLGSKIIEIRDDILVQLKNDHKYYLCHGDYKVDNLIYYSDKLYIFDFGSACKGHKEFDIASFITHLKIGLHKYGNPEHFDVLKEKFITTYANFDKDKFNKYLALLGLRILDYYIAFPNYEDNKEQITFGYQLAREGLKTVGYNLKDEL